VEAWRRGELTVEPERVRQVLTGAPDGARWILAAGFLDGMEKVEGDSGRPPVPLGPARERLSLVIAYRVGQRPRTKDTHVNWGIRGSCKSVAEVSAIPFPGGNTSCEHYPPWLGQLSEIHELLGKPSAGRLHPVTMTASPSEHYRLMH
jgi:hypothetical protein